LAKAFIGIWLVVWVGAFVLYASQAIYGQRTWHMLLVTAPDHPDSFPTIRGIRPAQGPFERLVSGDPRPAIGDLVLRAGDTELRGAGQLRFDGTACQETGPDQRMSLLLERRGETLETWVEAWPMPATGDPAVALVYGLLGLILVVRAPRSRAARLLGAGGMIYALVFIPEPGPPIPAAQHYAWFAMVQTAVSLHPVLIFTGLLYFPDELPPPGRAVFALPWLLGVLAAVSVAGTWAGLVVSTETGRNISAAYPMLSTPTALGIVTWKYRRATPVGRRRIKWFVFGCYLALLPVAAASAAWLVEPELLWLMAWVETAHVFVPLSLLISIVRFNLFDIDRLISATAAYTLVGIALLAGLLVALPPAASALHGWLGLGRGLSQLALAVIAAGLAIPIAERLRPEIERVFVPDHHRLQEGTHALIQQLSECREPRELIELAGRQLTHLLRPESCAVYGRRDGEFSPVFVRGHGGPPRFDAAGPLVAALEQHTAPVAMERFARRVAVPALSPFDRAALETLEAAVVLPIHRRGARLAGLLCLGPRCSGDVYTSSDLAMLAAVGDKISSELLRFEQEDLARQADAMRAQLRRYVPGAVQEQLDAAGEALAGEREVTVLFVDIRGYTAFAQDREAGEIFSAVNRYTQAVSEIVRRHEGNVVEFNGDGMMAVFSAPQELPDKERKAVEAGLEIGEAMPSLGLTTSGGEPLTVGVGIASGPAYVGSVQSADRAIWTALGNTTNLAARLQSLTRDLDAAIVIDAATQAAAGLVVADFEKRERVEIRGRRDPEDLYLKPVAA
jgi:class 3 adenylate cyclase